MARKRRRFDAAFKAKVALEAVRGLRTVSEIAKQFKVHPNQVTLCKKQLLAGAPQVFESSGAKASPGEEPEAAELYEQDHRFAAVPVVSKSSWSGSKKKRPRTSEELKRWIDWDHPALSVRRQCEVLGVHRSRLYYEPVPETQENLGLMRLIDAQYLKTPFWGSRHMTEFLRRQGYGVNRKRIQRLMRAAECRFCATGRRPDCLPPAAGRGITRNVSYLSDGLWHKPLLKRKMGLEGIAPGPSTSRPQPGHTIYPYLLRGVAIERPNQVWSSDITYVPLKRGFLYLVAVMDWYSRYVLSWRLSNSLEVDFCLEALDEALAQGTPEIFNTDQGSQFTSHRFTERLLAASIAVSMDGRGRALDNAFIERLWRSVKYEEIYLKGYESGADCHRGLTGYFRFYSHERPHQSLDYRTPWEMHQSCAARRR